MIIIEQKQTTCQQQKTTKFHSERIVDNTNTLNKRTFRNNLTDRQDQPEDKYYDVLDTVVFLGLRYGQSTMSIERIASLSGCNDKTADKHLRELTRKGYITYHYISQNKSIIRTFHELFYDMHIRKQLRQYLPVLKRIKIDELACPELDFARGGYDIDIRIKNMRAHAQLVQEINAPIKGDSLLSRMKLYFTPATILPLMAFSQKALNHAMFVIQAKGSAIRDKLKYFWRCCYNYEKSVGQRPNFALLRILHYLDARERLATTTTITKIRSERRGELHWARDQYSYNDPAVFDVPLDEYLRRSGNALA